VRTRARFTTAVITVSAGVCSSFLTTRMVGDEVPVFVKQSLFRMPDDPTRPIVMIGAGTGCAPFRGFIQERIARQAKLPGCRPGRELNFLFAGFGWRDVDFLFKEELTAGDPPCRTGLRRAVLPMRARSCGGRPAHPEYCVRL
jgi:sulfite reductase alpha subunit-like flavoprotein